MQRGRAGRAVRWWWWVVVEGSSDQWASETMLPRGRTSSARTSVFDIRLLEAALEEYQPVSRQRIPFHPSILPFPSLHLAPCAHLLPFHAPRTGTPTCASWLALPVSSPVVRHFVCRPPAC